MKKMNLWKRRKAIKWYAVIAITLITIFQSYWLYSVYQSNKQIILKESENILRKTVLEFDNKTIQDQITNSIGKSSEMDDVTRQLLNVLKNKNGLSVKISVEGQEFNDSVSKQLMERLTEKEATIDKEKSKKIYNLIKEELTITLGKINFSVYHYNKDVVDFFPLEFKNADAITEQVRSEMDGKQYYEIHFANVTSIVIRDMISSIILSLIYLIMSISAVILLILNVDKSRKLMMQKDNFTNNMTHEFKTPMATIYAAIEAMNTYNVLDDKEMAKEYLGMMKKDLDRLINMTDSILFNAKMSDGEVMLNFENTNLKIFIEEIKNNLKQVLENKHAKVEITATHNDLFINADTEHFGNVFRNLIDNSIKYSKENAAITITISKEGKFAKILFSDQGMGIPYKYKSEIFKPYFRVQENDVYSVKGYGLGLSYIKQIIILHLGKIELVTKDNNKGTTFQILIPLAND
ncbi:sensor histidine kinase [Flavobacterium aquatile]|uniref:histidine kinase n=1 Tax=Flavobacterium aquatile LMG 4008 = ATCC 11947 TaxID=1453498 RepID=A0A095TX94_9FLAO|nr:HAMP domain-containing sensor histidine kinase [Flavobacterium aquatile]KGD66993.1 hypothetical protein LG45_16395 [Flavobacterium aquatile LMG 4008 = ATCC 11947]OXA68088.1 two-component sensor histidine kinase [Flavobacterium aquatile LMG 4008 = ATCC 11947]GEC80163.1 hypothetical protein FAQ01_30330 [Flavobacterium aquatile]